MQILGTVKLIQFLSENYDDLVHLYPLFRELTWRNCRREDIPSTLIERSTITGSSIEALLSF